MQFTFESAFALGYKTFKSRYPALLGAVMVHSIITFSATTLMEVISTPTASILLGILFLTVFSFGIQLFGLQHVRGESPGLGTLFVGFQRYFSLLVISWIFGIIFSIFLGPVVALFKAGYYYYTTFAAIPALAFLLLFLTRLSFSGLLCIDPRYRLNIVPSITRSWRITGPVLRPFLGLCIVLILVILGSLLMFGLPFLFIGYPLSLCVWATAYELITNEAMGQEAQTTTPP